MRKKVIGMEKIHSLDEYYALLSDIKKNNHDKKISSNCFLSAEAVKRLLKQGRLYVIRLEDGMMFLSDEGLYYRGYYCWNPETPKTISALEKPLLTKHIYYQGHKKEDLLQNENILSLCGFRKSDTNCQVEVGQENDEQIHRQLQLFDRILEKGNFKIEYAKPEQYEEILCLRRETPEFSCFTFSYLSNEEILQGMKEHSYICVFDRFHNICATTYVDYGSMIPEGNGLCVKEAYKKRFGFGGALLYRALSDSFEKGYKRYYGWITEGREASVQFHERMGFQYTGKVEEDWILGGANNK